MNISDLELGSYESRDQVDWNTLPPDKRQAKINKSRNYIRYKLATGRTVSSNHPLLTPEEAMIVRVINDNLEVIARAKIGLFNTFYDNCPKVGSTLKRKEKKV